MFVAARANTRKSSRTYAFRINNDGAQLAHLDVMEGSVRLRSEGSEFSRSISARATYLIGALAMLITTDDGNSHCASSKDYITAELVNPQQASVQPDVLFKLDGVVWEG